jgi:hypothetical protein
VGFSLLYFRGCPNWQVASDRFRAALDEAGFVGEDVEFVQVESDTDAIALEFRGSPTFMVDEADLFDGDDVPVGLTCRIYQSRSGGLAGLPELPDLTAALRRAMS